MTPFNLVIVCNPASKLSHGCIAAIKQLKGNHTFELAYGNSWSECQKSNENITKCDIALAVPGGDWNFLLDLVEKRECTWVHSWFAGVDALMPLVAKLPIEFPVTNSKGGFARPLMEWAVGMMLYFSKDVTKFQDNQKNKKWDQWFVGELYGKTVGIVGYGGIGQEIGRVAKSAFGMKVLALRSQVQLESPHADQVLDSNINEQKLEVFRKSDFIVACLPQTQETLKFCGRNEFAAMKPDGVFISIGRGTTVDEDALLEVLKTKAIRGAAMDVFEVEPLSEKSGLWELPNCLISCHNADWVPSFTDGPLKIVEDNLKVWEQKSGKPSHSDMITPIAKERGY